MLPEPNTSQTQSLRPLSLGLRLEFILKALPAVFMISFLAVGSLSVFLKNTTYSFTPTGSWINGQAAAAYEAHFNENLPFKDAYISTWGIIEYMLFNQAREGALLGDEGWFFTSEEFSYYPNEAQAIAEKLAYISEVKEQLAAQDIDLVVTLVPSKASIYPEFLGRFGLPDYVQQRYDLELQALRDAGVPSIDLRSALKDAKSQGDVFFKTDTHWTPLGAKAAASEIAQEMQALGFDLPFAESSFVTNPKESLTLHEGDLMKFLPLGFLKKQFGPLAEPLQEATTVQTNVGLFADTSRPVTLVGTSYSGDEKWNFAGALKESLGMNVLNAALVGRGEIVPMQEYLASENPTVNKPQVIIWQLSDRGFPMAAAVEN